MSPGLARLNALPEAGAIEELRRCCGSRRWAEKMAAVRPYASEATLFEQAERVWWPLGKEDWLEAFAQHPRIGERSMERAGEAGDWAKEEQSGAAGTSQEVRRKLEEGNREYERRFGFVYLVCATGRSAPEMLEILTERLENDAPAELREAAEQQSRITRLRLERLLRR